MSGTLEGARQSHLRLAGIGRHVRIGETPQHVVDSTLRHGQRGVDVARHLVGRPSEVDGDRRAVDRDGDGEPGYDIEALEANNAVAVEYYTVTLDSNGEATVPVTLTDSPDDDDEAGYNYFVAAHGQASGDMGLASNVVVLKYEESTGGTLASFLNEAGYTLPPLPNLFFLRDPAMVIGDQVVVAAMQHQVRWTEEVILRALFTHHPLLANEGILYDGAEEGRTNTSIEGGDVHVLRKDVVAVGVSERTSAAGIDTLRRALFRETDVTELFAVLMPRHRTSIHLDMIFTLVDRDAAGQRARDALLDPVDDVERGLDAHVAGDEHLLELVERLVVDGVLAPHHAVDLAEEVGLGLLEPLLEPLLLLLLFGGALFARLGETIPECHRLLVG